MKDFLDLVISAFKKEALKRLVFSRPVGNAPKKASSRLCAHRGKRILSVEYSLDGDTVSQKNVREEELSSFLDIMAKEYRQINLITELGDAELKYTKRGELVTLGADKLKRKFSGDTPSFTSAIAALDRKKNYILSGEEPFLIKLGISDKSGRVHDKRQGKFRQINRFLEYIEDVYKYLPEKGELTVYDLCCGKSYLSFAAYYYLTEIKGRLVKMLGIDLKRDVVDFCARTASELGFSGMHFICDSVSNTPKDIAPDMVISLHACDVATDIVLMTAARLCARVILSTPCCHKHLSDMISQPTLDFVTKYPKLRGKLCEAITDALRLEYLDAFGYDVMATELTDPDDTPKNTLIRAIRTCDFSQDKYDEFEALLKFTTGDKFKDYLPEC